MSKASAKKRTEEALEAPVMHAGLRMARPLGQGPRSKEARKRGPNLIEPENVPDIDTPGWGRKRGVRYHDNDLVGEERMDLLRRIRDCALSGMTDFEIEEALCITPHALSRWAADDPAVAACLEIPAQVALSRVERALFHKAVGYSFRSEEIKVIDDKVVRIPIVKHVPPSDTAAIFYLKNRAPDRWADVQKHEHEGTIDTGTTEIDPRKLAMAILATLQEGMDSAVHTIEHVESSDETDSEEAESERSGDVDGHLRTGAVAEGSVDRGVSEHRPGRRRRRIDP